MNKDTKWGIGALVLALGIVAWTGFRSPTNAAAAPPREIAYFDRARVWNDSAIGKKAQADIREETAAQQKRVNDAQAEAEKAKGTEKEKAATAAYAQIAQAAQSAVTATDRRMREVVSARAGLAAGKLGSERGFAAVENFAAWGVVWARDDLTPAVIAQLDGEETSAVEELAKAKAEIEQLKKEKVAGAKVGADGKKP